MALESSSRINAWQVWAVVAMLVGGKGKGKGRAREAPGDSYRGEQTPVHVQLVVDEFSGGKTDYWFWLGCEWGGTHHQVG